MNDIVIGELSFRLCMIPLFWRYSVDTSNQISRCLICYLCLPISLQMRYSTLIQQRVKHLPQDYSEAAEKFEVLVRRDSLGNSM